MTPDFGLLFWMLIAFIVVFFVLSKFGFPAIIGTVEKRKNFIVESLRNAIVEDAQNKAREESARIINEAKAEIESLKKAAISDIRKQVALLSVEVSEKVLKQKLSTDKAQMDYIDIMLDEVTSSNNK